MLSFLVLLNLVNSTVLGECKNNKHFVLTFDDGPHENTPTILKILKNNNVKATFFINGIKIYRNYKNKKIIQNVINDGHSLGSHTFSHPSLSKISKRNVIRELTDNELIFRSLLNVRPLFWRPPYFDYDADILNTIDTYFKYDTITSNLNPQDWDNKSTEQIVSFFRDTLLSNNKTSYISLQHDNIKSSVDGLDQIIKLVKSHGYSIVSLCECLGYSNSYQQDDFYSPNLVNGLKK